MSFQEPNTKNIREGQIVAVLLPYPDTATFDEIAENYAHRGVVRKIAHSAGGSLLITVEGLERIAGREWAYANYVEPVAADQLGEAPIFAAGEKPLEVNIFQVREAHLRRNTKFFFGEVRVKSVGVYEVDNYSNDHVYGVKIEEKGKHEFRVKCECADYRFEKRVCKHIYEVFDQEKRAVLNKAA